MQKVFERMDVCEYHDVPLSIPINPENNVDMVSLIFFVILISIHENYS